MSIEVKIVADSISLIGSRITTFQLKLHRIVHDQFMTHRCFSRNASSMRAISLPKLMAQVISDPALPVFWGKEQKGMKARVPLNEEDKAKAITELLDLRDKAYETAGRLNRLGVHKQIASRLLMPWAWIHVIATATDLDGFFHQRIHRDAQPEIQILATAMARALVNSEPVRCDEYDWHLPYVKEGERTLGTSVSACISAARCARVSYENHDGTSPEPKSDFMLASKLLEEKHLSPFEHQAKPEKYWILSGNFRGWSQYRQALSANNALKRRFDYSILDSVPECGFFV